MMIRYWPGFEPTERDMHSRMPYPMFGVECGSGWDAVIAPVFAAIAAWNAAHPEQHITVDQVKEKYGTLRFYTSGCCEEIDALIDDAEKDSAYTCEACGQPAQTNNEHGWLVTLCPEHLKGYRAAH
jgi:hypothetical protein